MAADADAWSGPKGEIGEFVTADAAFGQEAFGIESVGPVPEIGMAVHQMLADDHHRPGWDLQPHDLVVIDRLAGEPPDGRAQAQGFLQHQTGIGVRSGFDILTAPFGGPRMLAQGGQGPGQGVGGGFVAGGEHGDDFVAQLLFVHMALLFHGIQQQVQQIGRGGLAFGAGLTAVGNQPDHHVVDGLQSLAGAFAFEGGQPLADVGHGPHAFRDVLLQHGDGLADGGDVLADVAAEHGFDHQIQRQFRHDHGHIQRGGVRAQPGLDFVQFGDGGGADDSGQGLNGIGGEFGLHQTALALPQIAAAGQ